MATCIEWADERTQECSEWADQGHNECASFRAECCDWWPCSWACEVVSWVCDGFVWVANVVCVGWTWVTTAICVAWDVVTMMISAVLVIVEFIVGGVLSVLAAVVELLQAIPVLGALIRWVINGITLLVWTIVSIPDAVLGLIGIRPEKKLRVCTVILRDDARSMATTADIVALLQLACNVYKRDANVRIIPHWPLQITSGFAGPETVTDKWVTNDGYPSDEDVLTAPCGAGGAGNDWLITGAKFQLLGTRLCFTGAFRRVIGYGAPIAVFIIRDIPNALGCSIVISDYVTVDGMASDPADPQFSPRTIGHEVGHSCNLWGHTCVDEDDRNLMATQEACSPPSGTEADRVNPRMSNLQVLLVRASKHVTYF